MFGRVREKPQFWIPFAVLAALQALVAVLMLPYLRVAMRAMPAEQGGAGQLPEAAAWFGVVAAPIGFALNLLVAAAVLWIFVSLVCGESSFRHLLSVATYSGITGVAAGLATVAVLALSGGPDRVRPMADLQAAFGFDLLAPDASPPLRTPLGAVNFFSVYGLVLTGLGVAATHKISKAAAFAAAAAVLLVSGLIAAGFAMLGGG